jgi:hypothetical protein
MAERLTVERLPQIARAFEDPRNVFVADLGHGLGDDLPRHGR